MQITAPLPYNPVTTQSHIRGFLIAVWFLYLLLKPLYIFPKGLPQPSDILLICGLLPGLAFALLNARARIPSVYLVGSLFAALTFAINWINFSFYPNGRFVLSSLYYPYNIALFIFIVVLFRRDYERVVKLSAIAIAASIIIQAFWAHFFPDIGLRRMTAGFANPNQLSYWALLSGGMLFFLRRDQKFTPLDYVTFFLMGFIQTLALSKAGLFATMTFYVVLCFSPQTHRFMRYIFIFIACVIALYTAFAPTMIANIEHRIEAFERVSARLETVGTENDDSPEGRGYNRIVNNPEYLIIGAGEGAYSRFRTWASSNELHSGLATLLFSYGIFGFGFFMAFLFLIFHRQPWYCLAILFSIMLFSLTSQTIRFTHTWVFFAIAYATFIIPSRSRSHSEALPPNRSESALVSA